MVTNPELSVLFPEWSADAIHQKTGVKKRHASAPGEISSDLAFSAAEKLFRNYSIERNDIDFLIFCTQSPDHYSPTTACLLQDRLKLEQNCGALDINLGCTGYVYGLSLAKGLIETGNASNVLFLTAETLTKYIHPKDKGCRTIFGDAASASLICGRKDEGIGQFVFGTDGSGKDIMIYEAGALRTPNSPETAEEFEDDYGNITNRDSFRMNGLAVFNFTLKTVPKLINSILEKESLRADQVDWFLFHQANGFLLKALQKKLKLPADKFIVDIENTGNTVATTIPIALSNALEDGRIKKGDKVLLAAFGVGLSWAATVVQI